MSHLESISLDDLSVVCGGQAPVLQARKLPQLPQRRAPGDYSIPIGQNDPLHGVITNCGFGAKR